MIQGKLYDGSNDQDVIEYFNSKEELWAGWYWDARQQRILIERNTATGTTRYAAG